MLIPTGHDTGSARWEVLSKRQWAALAGGVQEDEESPGSDALEELAGIEDEALERTGEVTVFFRDPSGMALPGGLWYPSPGFWGIVKSKTAARLRHGA